YIFDPIVVFMSYVSIISFTPTGIPCKGPIATPESIFLSISWAKDSASGLMVIKAFNVSFVFSILSSISRMSSITRISLFLIRCDNSVIDLDDNGVYNGKPPYKNRFAININQSYIPYGGKNEFIVK